MSNSRICGPRIAANSGKRARQFFHNAGAAARAILAAAPDLESRAMPQTIRNIAIILALAAAVDFLPGGGNAANAVLTTLSLIFLAAIA
jgi:hypothetical protein